MPKKCEILSKQYNRILPGLSYLFLCLLSPLGMNAQTTDPWVRFFDSSGQYGYKDLQGNIKVPAMFETRNMTSPDTFYNIVAVAENNTQYYLLKNGKKVGVDSVYSFEWAFDGEQEGKIRFQDHALNRVGFLDKNGQPIIPAIYNYALPFRNGMSLVGYGATYTCIDEWEKADTSTCEHYGWVGGVEQIINEKNEILIDSVAWGNKNLDWYSLRTNWPNPDTSLYFTVTGREGVTYSFLDYDKEFTRWFDDVFLPAVESGEKVKDHLFEEVNIRQDQFGKMNINKDDFLTRFPTALTPPRFQGHELKKISSWRTKLNPFTFHTPSFRMFYNACGFREDRFPVYEVDIEYKKVRQPMAKPDAAGHVMPLQVTDYREQFTFIRTQHGYQLISANFRE